MAFYNWQSAQDFARSPQRGNPEKFQTKKIKAKIKQQQKKQKEQQNGKDSAIKPSAK